MGKRDDQRRQEKEEAIARLREVGFIPGATVYTSLRSVSASGMSREIRVHIIHDGRIISPNYWVAQALGWKLTKNDAIRVSGCGMDMGFHLVYSLARYMFDPRPAGTDERLNNFRHEWI